MYNMSITSFGVLIVIVLWILESSTAITTLKCPSGNVNVGSTVTLTCIINPAKAMTWKRGTNSLANCDTLMCTVRSSPTRYAFTTDSDGQTVNLTITPVETDDDNKEFQCITSSSSDSCILSVSSTTTASTTVQPDNIGLIAGMSVLGGIMVVSMIVVACYMIYKGIKQRRLDQWRREFKLVHVLNQLIFLEKIWKKPANNKKASFELDCVFEVYPSEKRNEILSEVETQTLASQLVTLLGNHLNEAVIIYTHGYKTQLKSRSLSALLKVIDVLRGNIWNKILHEKNQYLRTQLDETSFRDCITHFKDQWRRQFTLVRELKVLKCLEMHNGKNANDGKASFDCVIEVYSTEKRNEITSEVETLTLASLLVTKLDTLLGNNLYETVSARDIISVTCGYKTQLQCRSLSALLKVVRVLRGNIWNKILREMEQENQYLRTQVDETSFRDCITHFKEKHSWFEEHTSSGASSLSSVRFSVDSQSEDTDSNSDLETYRMTALSHTETEKQNNSRKTRGKVGPKM